MNDLKLRNTIKKMVKEAVDDSIPAFGSPYDEIPEKEWRHGFHSLDRIKKREGYDPREDEWSTYYELGDDTYDTFEDALSALDMKEIERDSEDYRDREELNEEEDDDFKSEYARELMSKYGYDKDIDAIGDQEDDYINQENDSYEAPERVKHLLDMVGIGDDKYQSKNELLDQLRERFTYYRRVEPNQELMKLCREISDMLD